MPGRPIDDRLRRAALVTLGSAARLWPGGGSAVLCLHSVREAPATGFAPTRELAITPEFLEALILDLRAAGAAIVPLHELFLRLRQGKPGRCVALTFDDGYADNALAAFPVFQRLAAPFTIFLATGFLDRTVPMWWSVLEELIGERDEVRGWDGALPARGAAEKDAAFAALSARFRRARPHEIAGLADELMALNPGSRAVERALALPMDWETARALSRSGLVTMGCHTVSHPTLGLLSRSQVEAEIFAARDRIAAELGAPPLHFAYPYGSGPEIEPHAPELVRAAGFAAGWTTRRNLLGAADLADPYRLPRVTLDGRYQDARVMRAYLSGIPFALRDGVRRALRAAG